MSRPNSADLLSYASEVSAAARRSGPTSNAPLVDTAAALVGLWGAQLIVVAIVLATTGVLAADVLNSPRVFHALAAHKQMPAVLAAVPPRFGMPAVAVTTYAVLCALVALTGSSRQSVIAGSSGTLVLYLICCLGLLRLRSKRIATGGEAFRIPGGPFVPLAACAIIVWMLTTLKWKELIAAFALVAVSSLVYWLQPRIAARCAS